MRHQRSFLRLGALFLLVTLLAGTISPALSATWSFVKFVDFVDTPNLFPEVVSSPSGDFYLAYLQESGGFQDLKILKWNGSSWDTLHTLTPSTPNINITTFGDYLSLVVNSDDDIHLAFRGYLGTGSTSTRGVHYGHYDGSTWTFDDVAVVSDPNGWKDVTYPALAVDGNDHPHLVYVTDDANGSGSCTLVYAVKNGTWAKTTLLDYTTGDEYIGYPSLVLDSTAHAYVAYIDDYSAPTRLYLSTDTSSAWSRSALVTQQASHYLNLYDLRIDAADMLYLTYTDSHSSNVDSYYGTNAGGSWAFELVPGSTGYDISPHLVLNANGVKLLSYISGNLPAIRYLKVAYRSGSDSWQVEQADSSADIDATLTAAINASNQVMIVEERQDFVDWTWKQFWYATANLSPTGVTGVTLPANGTYKIGQSLDFTVSFSENVTVDTSGGLPYLPLTLNSGGTVPASYVSGSGTSALVFRYTVASGDLDPDGISLGTDLILNGGSIKNGGGADADLTLSGVPSSAGILVDGVAPDKPVINTPANGSFTNDNTPTIGGTAEANSSVTITLDGSPGGSTTANATGNWSWIPGVALPDGSHSAQATATDTAGNTGPASDANSFTVDTLAPAPPLVSVPADGTLTNHNQPAFSGTAEPGSTVSVLVDATLIGTCSANGSGDWTFTPPSVIADGTHQVAAYATDQAGNSSSNSAGNGFTVDTTPPAAPTLEAPADGSLTNQNQPAVSGTAEANSTVSVFIDSSQAGSTLSGATGSWTFTPSSTLADGLHSVYASAADAAGNSSSSSDTHAFTVDSLAPAIPSITSPAGGTQTNNTRPPISGTAEPASEINVYLDGSLAGSATATGTGSWDFTPSALADGTHSVQASARDAAGNTSSLSNTVSFTVDTQPPAVSLASLASDPTNAPKITVTATFNEAVTGFDIASIAAENASAGNLTGSGASYTFDLTPAGQGMVKTHILAAAAHDAAGNSSLESSVLERTYDSLPPSLLNITREDTSPTRAGSVQFALSFDEPVSGVDTADFALTVSGSISGQAIQDLWESGGVYHVAVSTGSGSGTIRLDLVDNGSITDPAGNPLAGSGVGWQDGRYSGGETYEIDRTIPVAELLNPDNLPHSGNMPYTFTVRFTDNQGIDPAVFGDANISMSGTGFNQLARKIKVIEIVPGTQYEVTYQVDPPDKGWERLSAPSFDLILEPDQIHDLCDNYLGEQTLGNVVKEKIYFYMPFV